MPATLSEEQLIQQSGLVFRGTVQKLKAATMSRVPVSDQTVVVRVDEVLQAPETLEGLTGTDVTVELGAGQSVQAGEEAIFYTNGWMFGESVAVRAVGVRPVPRATRAVAGMRGVEPPRNLRRRRVEERVSSADLVVTGRVRDVRLPADEAAPQTATRSPRRSAGKRAAGGEGGAEVRRRPISEHDPKWREAVVEVAGVEKGGEAKEVVIRFPSSNDVRWYRAPKFEPGQEGVFILHKAEPGSRSRKPRRRATVTAAEAEAPEAYTCLAPEDFQPMQSSPEIKTLLGGTSGPGEE